MQKKKFGRKVTTVNQFRREKYKITEYNNGLINYNMNYLINFFSDMTVRHTNHGDCKVLAMNVLKLVKKLLTILEERPHCLNFKTVFNYSELSFKR